MSTKPKSRLGRGLSSLISVSELPVERELPPAGATPSVESGDGAPVGVDPSRAAVLAGPGLHPTDIPVDAIGVNPHQPRRQMNEAALAELAASLKSTGMIQPVIVRRNGDTGYQLIAGERRWRAARLAGLGVIPAIIRDVDSFTQAQMALVENIQREDLNAIDRALAYRTLMEQLGLTQTELATRLGEDRSTVANFIRLLDLAEPVRQLVRDGKLSLGHAKIIAGVADILEQQRLAELVISQDLSVRNLERIIQGGPAREISARKAGPISAHIADLEKSLARQLGMRVQVRSGQKGKGRLVIHYGSLDQFDDLLQRLGLRTD